MFKKSIYILLLVLVVFSQLSLYSQDTIRDGVAINKDKQMIQMNLPLLSEFFKNIQTHPSVGIYETYKEEAWASLGIEKQKWLDYLRVVTNYQYGKNYSFSENVDITESVLLSSDRANHTYSVGVSLSIPIGDLASRNKRIKRQEAIFKRVQYEYDLAVEQRKLMILEAYNTVVEQLATIKAKSESATLYNAQIKISENDFKMGKINIISLSQERGRRAAALVTFEEAKVQLYNSVTLLEMLSGVDVLN